MLRSECSSSWISNQATFALEDCVIEGNAEQKLITIKGEGEGMWKNQDTTFKLLSGLLSQQLQNIKNKEESLKYTGNFISTKKGLAL